MANAIFEPLIERDFDRFDAAARAFAAQQSEEELWLTLTRFAVLAHSSSQHSKRAVLACRAAHEVREEAGGRWLELILECGRYAGESRQPWSEPPLLDAPAFDPAKRPSRDALREAIDAKDLPAAERWLAARGVDAGSDLRAVARGDALLVADAAIALLPLLGEKGSHALFRIVLTELIAADAEDDPGGSLEERIGRVAATRGAVDAVRSVFLLDAGRGERPGAAGPAPPLEPYRLARDYAQTLIAHAVAPRLRRDDPSAPVETFLAAVHDNLLYGESFAEWSFA